MYNESIWERECNRCGTGCDTDYCHDCQRNGHDKQENND